MLEGIKKAAVVTAFGYIDELIVRHIKDEAIKNKVVSLSTIMQDIVNILLDKNLDNSKQIEEILNDKAN